MTATRLYEVGSLCAIVDTTTSVPRNEIYDKQTRLNWAWNLSSLDRWDAGYSKTGRDVVQLPSQLTALGGYGPFSLRRLTLGIGKNRSRRQRQPYPPICISNYLLPTTPWQLPTALAVKNSRIQHLMPPHPQVHDWHALARPLHLHTPVLP